jgi:hypothetical protein
MSVATRPTTQRHVSEHLNPQLHGCEQLKLATFVASDNCLRSVHHVLLEGNKNRKCKQRVKYRAGPCPQTAAAAVLPRHCPRPYVALLQNVWAFGFPSDGKNDCCLQYKGGTVQSCDTA